MTTKPADEVERARAVGMEHALWASLAPDRPAIIDAAGEVTTFAQLNARANQVARLLRARGVQPGDGVALVCSNRREFAEVLSGALRVGARLTPINWHLTPAEIDYIVSDCHAVALFVDTTAIDLSSLTSAASVPTCIAIGGAPDPFFDYERSVASLDSTNIDAPVKGFTMLYTSGTTGRPKGVLKPNAKGARFSEKYDRDADIHLCTGPLYHSAPLTKDLRTALLNGVPAVLQRKWDSESVLATIAQRKITHTHLVPIMFQRLLALPESVRTSYDVSSLKLVVHGAAPCPPDVKRAMIEWWGPILEEYYSASEGGAGFKISSEEWLRKPGSVGRRPEKLGAKALDDNGRECQPNIAGTIYHQLSPGAGFTYFNDDSKTAEKRIDDYFTTGDVGYFDEDGYLFLTGRDAEIIISGGVNIYPQEIDNVLLGHASVADSATIGAPNDEWGEEVLAVVRLRPEFEPTDDLASELIERLKQALPSFKVPRRIDFVRDLPRSEAGKVLRNRVREQYWRGRARQI